MQFKRSFDGKMSFKLPNFVVLIMIQWIYFGIVIYGINIPLYHCSKVMKNTLLAMTSS